MKMDWLDLPSNIPNEPYHHICAINESLEPLGEEIRKEFEALILKYGIASLVLELDHHFVKVDIDTLPNRMRNVLRTYGSIYVKDNL